MSGKLLLIFLFRTYGNVEECLALLTALQQTLFVKPVKRSHDGGIGQTPGQFLVQVAHADLAAGPYAVHHFSFQAAQLFQ